MNISSDAVVFGHDEEFGVTDYFEWDAATETFRVSSVQEVGNLLEFNKAIYNSFDERTRWRDGLNRVAEIPLVLLHELRKQGIADEDDAASDYRRLRKWLDDRDNSGFRTRPGRLAR